MAAAWICLPRIFPDPDQALARPLALHLHTTTTPLRGAPVSSTNLTALGPRRAQKPFASAPTPLLVVAFAFAPLAPTPSLALHCSLRCSLVLATLGIAQTTNH